MFTTEPGLDRWQLGFTEAVKLSFDFVKKYGLKPVQEEVTLVRYQSEKVILNVYHGRGSYELGAEFERVGFSGEKFSLHDTMKWAKAVGKVEEIPTGGYQASSREVVQMLVAQMAELVKSYAEPLLQGDAETYQALREQQSSDAAEYTREVHLRAVRKQAETAWQDKDYEKLLGLYSDMQGELTPSEFMRFQYAEKQLLSAHSSHPKDK
jgi:hypothetical protein